MVDYLEFPIDGGETSIKTITNKSALLSHFMAHPKEMVIYNDGESSKRVYSLHQAQGIVSKS